MTCWPGVRLLDSASVLTRRRMPSQKRAGHAELDVGLEQRGADLLERLVEVGVADTPLAPEAGGDPLQAVGEGVEHGVPG